jgi:hypothetical protein
MTRPSLVSTGGVSSFYINTKPTSPMNTNSASTPFNPKPVANGGEYVTEGMAVQQQQLAPGALTPVL